jgi:hypothetical protein
VARQNHELSRRRNRPFVALNCAALVETLLEAELLSIEDRTASGVRGRRGKFEHAEGGTLFLDEVSDLSLSAQAKLLRAVQDLAVEHVDGTGAHRVDIRIVAATNRSLVGLVERHLLRPDLYYRLAGVDIRVSALRERRADILELARYFLERHRAPRALRLSAAAADALMAYDWPGNVRELERLMERAVALAGTDVIGLDDLPPGVRGEYATTLMPSLEHRDTLRAWGSRTPAWCSNAARGTSARPVACSTSAITRCRRICDIPPGAPLAGPMARGRPETASTWLTRLRPRIRQAFPPRKGSEAIVASGVAGRRTAQVYESLLRHRRRQGQPCRPGSGREGSTTGASGAGAQVGTELLAPSTAPAVSSPARFEIGSVEVERPVGHGLRWRRCLR